MFARWSRLPLRRCLHTPIPPAIPKTQFSRLYFVFGISAATASYLTWRLSSDSYRIALDSSQAGKLSGPRNTTPSSINTPTPAVVQSSSETTEEAKAGSEDTPQDEEEGTLSNGDSGGAFNPETGEINWDCPCLGGMAHGPCGPQFREAFSCFVFSEAEPKGMDCIEKFKAMQDCFREHPDVYADEIMDDEEEEGAPTAGEESSTATGVVGNEKDRALTTSSPQTESISNDIPSDTPASTASS